jgi:formiminotetrahydrofolate cyclodeaminase
MADEPGALFNRGKNMDDAFLKALAQARPDPGGGAAAAHSAAMGLALLEKVVRLEHRRQPLEEEPGSFWSDLLAQVRLVAASLQRLQAEDVEAYFQLTRARTQGAPNALAAALDEAVACPLRIMQQAQEGLCLLLRGGARCRPHLISDLLVACELLGAAYRGAHHIARANLPLMGESSRRAVWAANLTHTLAAIESEFQQVQAGLLVKKPCP